MARKTILYFRIWANPPISTSVERLLRDTFPEYDLETITLWDLIKSKKRVAFLNFFHVLKEYGRDILLGRLHFKSAFFRTTFIFDEVCTLVKELGKRKKNIVFTFQLQSIFDAHIEGVPHFVYTDHTHLANLQYSPMIRVYLYSAEWICREKLIYDHADRIFTRSSDISRSLIDQYGMDAKKVQCIYAGPNTTLPELGPVEKDYSAKDILFVGLDWRRKGGPDLLKAFEQIHPKHPDATLTIVGGQVSTHQAGVISVGRVAVGELIHYYTGATIFCMPSYNEPFGIVFVEAMAYGLPVVGTDIGAIPDMVAVGKNGYLIHPGDVDGLVGILDELLSDPQKRECLGRQSRQMFNDRYNWRSVGKRLRQGIMTFLEEDDE